MMKFRFLLVILFPIAALAQVLPVSKMESAFNKEQLTTDPVTLKRAPGINMAAFLSAAGDSLFLTLTGSGIGTGTVDKDNETVLTLENHQVVTIRSVAVQGFDSRGFVNTYRHAYRLTPEDLEALSRYKVRRLKKYSMAEYYEWDLEQRGADELKAMSAFFLQELYHKGWLRSVAKSTAPAFPGGKEVFIRFLNRNIKQHLLPQVGEKLRAVVQFQVKRNGSISDIKVLEAAGPVHTDELLRVLKRMPRWKPATEKGTGVDAVVTQELTFYRQDTMVSVQF